MKQLFLSLSLLLSLSLYGQNQCQSIEITYSSATPEITMDGFIDACAGDTVFVTAAVAFPESGTNYEQSVATSQLVWILNGQQVGQGLEAIIVPPAGRGSLLRLEVTDINSCTVGGENIPIRVAGAPDIVFTDLNNGFACSGDTITAIFNASQTDSFFFSNDNERIETISLPDNAMLTDFLTIDPGSGIITQDILNSLEVCITIEHSYLGDLDIILISPSGEEVELISRSISAGGGTQLGEPVDDNNDGNAVPGVGYEYCFSLNPPDGLSFAEIVDINQGSSLPAGTYLPDGDLQTLVGSSIAGAWSLMITDNLSLDDGYLFGWSINLPANSAEQPGFTSTLVSAEWQTGGPGFVAANGTELQFVVTPDSNVDYTVVATDDRGCTYEVIYQPNIIANDPFFCLDCSEIVADAGPDQEIRCAGNQNLVLLGGQNTTVGEGFTYLWTSNGVIVDRDLSYATVNPGEYVFSIMRGDDCVVSDTVLVTLGEIQEIEIGIDTLYLDCNLDNVEVTAQTIPQGDNVQVYWWSQNLDTAITTATVIINGPGIYTFAAFDSICDYYDELIVLEKDYVAAIEVLNTSCDVNDGAITITPAFEDEIISYSWSTGASGPTISGLGQGSYGLSITTATCVQEEVIYVDKDISCKATIGGYVIRDENCDGQGNGVECIMIHLLPDDIYTYTNELGYYEFLGEGGNDFTVEYIEEDIYELACGSVVAQLIGVVGEGADFLVPDFYVQQRPVQNLCISVSSGVARPGFDQYYCPLICNYGNVPSTATVVYTLDPLHEPDQEFLDYVTTYDAATHTATLEIDELQPGDCAFRPFYLPVSVDAPLDSTVTLGVTVLPVDNDAFPENNSYNLVDIVRGSYDPNDKQNRTGENPFGGNIYERDVMMRYQVRFQNTGTDTAFTVVIRDTLDTEVLNVESIRPGLSSHDYTVEFEGRNVLIFRFDNILLPDSTTNEPASNGFVNFTILRDPDMAIGTEIVNNAAIFFDFNAPIITNEVVNVLAEPVSVRNLVVNNLTIQLYPNPVSEVLTAGFTLTERNDVIYARIHDLSGRLIRQEKLPGAMGEFTYRTNVHELPAGQYVLEIVSGVNSGSIQFTKQ